MPLPSAPAQSLDQRPTLAVSPEVGTMQTMVETSIRGLERWVEEHHYKGYEPFDGLSSPLNRWADGNLLRERLLLQLIRQSPINLRPLFGVKPLDSTKGRGYMASGYLTMLKVTGDRQYGRKAGACLEWLIEHKSRRFSEYSWGNHFDFSSRGGRYRADEPIIVWTALIGQAFLDAYECLGDRRYLQIALSVRNWILALPRERTNSGSCISYHALHQASVHNANMLGAAMLARTAKMAGSTEGLDVAKAAMEYSCSRQQSNGSWRYAEGPGFEWIDNFHTAYNLDSLKGYIECTNDTEYDEVLRRGFAYWTNTFFESSGAPKYYDHRAYPIDSQCAAQAIETLAKFTDTDPESLALACKVARWTITNMRDPRGYFYYRRYPLLTAKTPMLHWAQATTYKALTCLYSRLTPA
jgi:rhamnogalacturonyl hydrolase YesR